MKTFFTLFTSLLMSIAVFAAAKPKSILTIKSTDNADIRVVLDGKHFDPNDNSLMLRGIDDGYHRLALKILECIAHLLGARAMRE